MHLEEFPDLVPNPDQVVMTVKASGVNPVDTYIRSGLYQPALELPYTPELNATGVLMQSLRCSPTSTSTMTSRTWLLADG